MISSYVQPCVNLFVSKGQNFSISYRESSDEDRYLVSQVFQKIGLSDQIASVHQPLHSAEINSKNFKVLLNSGDKLLLRQCIKFTDREHYVAIDKLLKFLREDGINAPEFLKIFSEDTLPYFEMGQETAEKSYWVFFKYFEATNCFSGKKKELQEAAQQVGKIHLCLKKHYSEMAAIPSNATDSRPGPSLTKGEWDEYLNLIESMTIKDAYDNLFLNHRVLIEKAIIFVMNNFALLNDSQDMQNIHFDLNSSNFLIDDQGQVRIMDYDTVQYGNVYTDIGFAFHRLLTTCMEKNEDDVWNLAVLFLKAYQQGNPHLDFDPDKLIVATYNRALRNIRSNLSLKYKEEDKQWLSSIKINIQRLMQVTLLCNKIKELQSRGVFRS